MLFLPFILLSTFIGASISMLILSTATDRDLYGSWAAQCSTSAWRTFLKSYLKIIRSLWESLPAVSDWMRAYGSARRSLIRISLQYSKYGRSSNAAQTTARHLRFIVSNRFFFSVRSWEQLQTVSVLLSYYLCSTTEPNCLSQSPISELYRLLLFGRINNGGEKKRLFKRFQNIQSYVCKRSELFRSWFMEFSWKW